MTIPLAPILGLAGGMIKPINMIRTGHVEEGIDTLMAHYTGYSGRAGRFDVNWLMQGLMPLVIGGLVHKFVGGAPLNLNRMLAQAGVPFIRI